MASSLEVGDRTLLLVAWDPHDLSDELTAAYVATLDPPREGMLSRHGTLIRNFHFDRPGSAERTDGARERCVIEPCPARPSNVNPP